ncbi:MAG: DsbA family protein [Candidatus Roizmanbacteria bacterium]|nr:DsbA family protein [Candidatus Roizmanbacteria bacterium]
MSPKKVSKGYSPFLLGVTILTGVVMVYGLIRVGDITLSVPRLTVPKFAKPTPPPPKQVLETKPFGITTNFPRLNNKDHISGRRNAQYMIVTYIDYDCEQCRDAYQFLQQFLTERKGDTALVVRHFPLDANPQARAKAVVAECIAQREGEKAFWAYTDTLLTSDPGDDIMGEECTESRDIARRLQADNQSASRFGIGGLPALYLINTKTNKALFAVGVIQVKQLQELVGQTK